MLIRMAQEKDIDAWLALAKSVSPVFGVEDMSKDSAFIGYISAKISKCEAIAAVDRMSGTPLGFIGFSKKHNRISWLAVDENHRGKGIGSKLLKCTINQMDWESAITVITFRKSASEGKAAIALYKKFGFKIIDEAVVDEHGSPRCKMSYKPKNNKKGGSFHYNYDSYQKWAKIESCPVCLSQELPYPPVLIKELKYSWVECYKEAQGRLFGKIHILSKVHSEHFYDMNEKDMQNFISDVKKTAKALHEATGAVKINYEIHGNSMPHLHAHLFPRYLDDDFPSLPIDYNLYEPSPYESDEEFEWFVEKMSKLIA